MSLGMFKLQNKLSIMVYSACMLNVPQNWSEARS